MRHAARYFLWIFTLTFLRAVLLLFLAVEAHAVGLPEVVSLSYQGARANAGSYNPRVSFEGRYVAFESSATNLVAGDTNGAVDVFVRDRTAGITERVSLDASGRQVKATSSLEAMSGDGRYVAFSSNSSFFSGDKNKYSDLYLRDRTSKRTEIVSVSTSGAVGNAASGGMGTSISQDGRYVVFTSYATNLAAATDTNNGLDVFVRDRTAKTTKLVSASSSGAAGSGDQPAMSPDGRYVVFRSSANLTNGSLPGGQHIYLRDTQSGITQYVCDGDHPSVSGDGRYVVVGGAYLYDRVVGVGRNLACNPDGSVDVTAMLPRMTTDGRFVGFVSSGGRLLPNLPSNVTEAFVVDVTDGTLLMLGSAPDGSVPPQGTNSVDISANGRYAVFRSGATNLVAADTNGYDDIFLRDLWGGSTPPLDWDGDGVANGSDHCPGTPAGQPVDSHGCSTGQTDPDSDGDGLPDSWELANFGTLALGPDDDPDHDGVLNMQEYLLHTDTRDREPPSAPLGISMETVWSDRIRLKWVPPGDNVGLSQYFFYTDGVPANLYSSSVTPPEAVFWRASPGVCHRHQITAVDFLGNESTKSDAVGAMGFLGPLNVSVVSPSAAQTVAASWISVDVGGVAPGDVVVVNGQPAIYDNGVARADRVDLQEGENVLTVYGQRDRVWATGTSVTVTRLGGGDPVGLAASRSSGTSPLTVTFSATVGVPGPLARVQWDLDGDGSFETDSTSLQERTSTFTQPRRYTVRVRVTDAAGVAYTAATPVTVYAAPTLLGQVSIPGAAGLAVDPTGNLYVAERSAGVVGVYAPDGSLQRRIGAPGTAPDQLSSPVGVGLDEEGNTYVLDAGTSRVHKYDTTGNHVLQFGSDRLQNPTGIAVRGSQVLVADPPAQGVHQFSTNGSYRGSIGGAEGPGMLDGPSGVTVLPGGDAVIADTNHHRVVRFDAFGKFMAAVGTLGTNEDQFNQPAMITWDTSRSSYLVADQANNRVVVLGADGYVKSMLRGGDLGFSFPVAAVGTSDLFRQIVYVVDTSGRVLKVEIPTNLPTVVWSQMKASLGAGDTEGALRLFSDAKRETYRHLFCFGIDKLPALAAALPSALTPLYIRETVAAYRMEREDVIDGVRAVNSYDIYFDKDANGEWRIRSF